MKLKKRVSKCEQEIETLRCLTQAICKHYLIFEEIDNSYGTNIAVYKCQICNKELRKSIHRMPPKEIEALVTLGMVSSDYLPLKEKKGK